MKNDEHLYLDVLSLKDRGWTDTLIANYLGRPDRWATVEHYRDFRGKRTYHLARVEQAELSDEFLADFEKSLSRRKISKPYAKEFQQNRESTKGQVEAWQSSLTKEDIRTMQLLEQITATFQDMRKKGLRTPHKA